jgi:hypothetical protein
LILAEILPTTPLSTDLCSKFRDMTTFSIASLKNVADEMRAQYYPKNDTEKRVN